jgi:2-hydroxycyclohexanecarboxyl-CoA dehydrogenase
MDLGLRDQVVLVTGSGVGIGRAIALAFAGEGAKVVVNSRSAASCEETVAMLRAQGADCMEAPFDISSLEEVRGATQLVLGHYGRIDVLVNNAAVMVNNLAFVEKDPADCEREIAVSLFGTMHCTREALPSMIKRGHGRIVNIISDAARVGQEKEVAYSAAKGGVISFTKSLAREVGQHGVTVNAVSPAATDTPLRRAMLARMAEKIGADGVTAREEKVRRAYPMRRIGQSEDTAALVLFLASQQAFHITGQISSVNGGFAMPG